MVGVAMVDLHDARGVAAASVNLKGIRFQHGPGALWPKAAAIVLLLNQQRRTAFGLSRRNWPGSERWRSRIGCV